MALLHLAITAFDLPPLGSGTSKAIRKIGPFWVAIMALWVGSGLHFATRRRRPWPRCNSPVQTTAELVGCPGCGVRAEAHGRRTVRVRDLPAGGRPVVLAWRKRIWRCTEPACGVRTWTEQVAAIRPRPVLIERARAEACRRVGKDAHAVAAVARDLGVGWATVMRAVGDHGRPLVEDPYRLNGVAALGLDETSLLKATRVAPTRYVTGLVDLECGRLLDLVADRTRAAVDGWLSIRPPDRFLSLGMAEQNMIGVAAGLAREGFTPLVNTFGVFLTRRVYDQVAMSVAYPNLRVRLLGFLPGLTTRGGVTHQAIDDVALMRVLPNMTVLDTGDATEVETVLDVADTVPGPIYCRVLRGEVPRLFSDPMRLDRVRVLSEGDDLCVVSSGICTEQAMRALAAVGDAGVSSPTCTPAP